MTRRYATLEEVQAKAQFIELAEVNFCNDAGEIEKDRNNVTFVQLIFIDAMKLNVPIESFLSEEGKRIKFKLRPKEPDA